VPSPRADTSPLDPERNALHALLRVHLATFLAEREHLDAPLPRFVARELEGYLDCGRLAAGCARFECEGCGLTRVTALSCKGRGFCPRCCGRRMTERARHLAERVFPAGVRVRQWVLSLPFDLRVRAAFDHALARTLARIAVDAIEERYRRLAAEAGLRGPRGGSVVVMQRFGSDLRLNLHLHGMFVDGAYGEDRRGGRRFARARAPSPAEVEAVLTRIVLEAHAWLEERAGEPALDDDERALAQNHAAASRAGSADKHRPDVTLSEQDGLVFLPTRRKARIDGFDLDAEVAVHEHERERLEHLCRYILRPPLALNRLKLLGTELVCIELKRPWSDGTTHVTMSPSVFLARLASLVPRPRANTTLYFGVLAAHSRDRAHITPERSATTSRTEDASWAALMRRSFGIDVLSCPRCKGRLRFVAVLFDPAEVKRLLAYLRCFSDPLPIHPARGPPEHEETFDFP
jgi:hypothetical protein